MDDKKVKNIIKKLPDAPGVYFFLGSPKRGGGGLRGRKILYIGKATSLKDRVRSYFNKDIVETRSPLIAKMLSEFSKIDFIKTDSVLEALILEAKLIKKFQPEANIKEKDNRSFNYVVITDEKFPRILIARERELNKNINIYDISYTFGPFANGSQLKEAMKIVRKMFPFRDRCVPFSPLSPSQGEGLGVRSKPCFNRQIGLCPGVCSGEISEKEYRETIKNIVLFFESDKKKLVKNLEKQMKNFAKNREFEKAQKIKKTIFTLNHIQDIALLKEEMSKGTFDTVFRVDPVVDFGIASSTQERSSDAKIHYRVEAYDVAHMSGKNVVGVMTVVENGEKKISDYRKFKIKNEENNDIKSLSEILTRRLAHIEWRFPDLIVIDGGKAQKNIAEKILKENNLNIPVVAVVKNEYHKPKMILGDPSSRAKLATRQALEWIEIERQILLANAEAHRFAISYHDKLRRKVFKF